MGKDGYLIGIFPELNGKNTHYSQQTCHIYKQPLLLGFNFTINPTTQEWIADIEVILAVFYIFYDINKMYN